MTILGKSNPAGNLPISGHTFDHGMDVRQSVVTLPAGFVFTGEPCLVVGSRALPLASLVSTKLLLAATAGAQPCESCPAQNHTFEHGVAYIAATGGGYIGAALHGMNSAGLAGGAQTLGEAKGPMLQYRAGGSA